jgi:hypothetical protein
MSNSAGEVRLVIGRATLLGGAQVLLILAVVLSACSPFVTTGTVPPPPPGGGVVDPQDFPDYVAALNRDGKAIAGYVPKTCLYPEPTSGPSHDESCPVYAADLLTLVGHMVPDKGFVPLGVDPAGVPPIPVQAGPSGAP